MIKTMINDLYLGFDRLLCAEDKSKWYLMLRKREHEYLVNSILKCGSFQVGAGDMSMIIVGIEEWSDLDFDDDDDDMKRIRIVPGDRNEQSNLEPSGIYSPGYFIGYRIAPGNVSRL